MSRVATLTPVQPAAPAPLPHEKVAQRAYEKWMSRGCTHGCDQQDWLEAEGELRTEMTRTSAPTMRR